MHSGIHTVIFVNAFYAISITEIIKGMYSTEPFMKNHMLFYYHHLKYLADVQEALGVIIALETSFLTTAALSHM